MYIVHVFKKVTDFPEKILFSAGKLPVAGSCSAEGLYFSTARGLGN
jgi:hypothetical protein